MQGLLFPIIMLTVTLVGGGLLLLVLKNTKKCPVSDEATMAMQTAQQFINARDIKDKYLYTKDGLVQFVKSSNADLTIGYECSTIYGALCLEFYKMLELNIAVK